MAASEPAGTAWRLRSERRETQERGWGVGGKACRMMEEEGRNKRSRQIETEGGNEIKLEPNESPSIDLP